MAVYRQDGSGLQGVQHALGTVVRGVAQVAVHPQPRRRLRLRGESVEKKVIDQHGCAKIGILRGGGSIFS